MGSELFKKIEPDLQKTLDMAISKKQEELRNCNFEIEKLIQDAILYRVLELNGNSVGLNNGYDSDRKRIMQDLRGAGLLKKALSRELESLINFKENPDPKLSELIEAFSKELQTALTGPV
jgi:hypothetical protein